MTDLGSDMEIQSPPLSPSHSDSEESNDGKTSSNLQHNLQVRSKIEKQNFYLIEASFSFGSLTNI